MTQVFGHFIEDLPLQDEYLTIGFSPSSRPLKTRWENNGLSADFISEYFKTFFVQEVQSSDSILVENLRDAVKYIANELLENAMKFQDENVPFTAKIGFSLYNDRLIFRVTNGINEEQVNSFQAFIKRLLSEDAHQLYFQAMRANAMEDENAPSRLGLLSMICDYSAKLGWKFETCQSSPPMMIVSTMVCLEI
jgi:hypothetical protein